MDSLQFEGPPNDRKAATGERFGRVRFPAKRFSNTQVGSEPFAKFSTVLLSSMGYESVDLIRSAWKRFVLIVQPLQFHYSLDDGAGTGDGRSGRFASRNQFEIRGRSNASPSAPRSLCESWSFAYIEKMGLRCLLLTRDAMLLKVMRTGFSAASVDLELRTDAASAIELSSRRHLDGFVIDCDDASGAREVLTKIRSSRSNQLSVIFVVVNATTPLASKAMANFVLTKPVPQSHLRGFLDIAVGRMEREHRRYFRHKANVPLQLLCNTGGSFAGKIKNVSEGGLALTHIGPTPAEGVVTVQFELPSAQPQTFQAKAAVVWTDAHAMGLRFLRIEPGCRSGFKAWLDSLEAQLRFRESIQ